ncbi:MAG: polysaccharide export protein [Salinivirgaceae bacterium]|jgi:polysaccharide export outer membrane protein|nr:polysaccharide export protein [Salinivirgaceae bacterium]
MKRALYILLVLFLMSSCISQKKIWLMQDQKAQTQTEFMNPQKEAYTVKTGDRLFIKVYSSDKQTSKFFQTDLPNFMNSTYQYINSYPIDPDGYLNFSFIEKIKVEGLTVREVEKALQETLNEYFKEVTVVVKLVNFQVTVLGEVNSEGKYTINEERLNLLQAIALSGGIKEFGDRRNVSLIRQTKTGSQVHYIDLTDKAILESDLYYIQPGDVIYVKSMKTKSFAYEKMPYSVLLSTLAVIASLVAILK